MRLRKSLSSASGTALMRKGQIALGSSRVTADPLSSTAGLVALAGTGDSTTVRVGRFPRRAATLRVISIWSIVFILLVWFVWNLSVGGWLILQPCRAFLRGRADRS